MGIRMTTSPAMIFVGAAHVDWLGRFCEPADRGLSVPGAWSRWGGGAAFNAASIVAGAGLPVILHSACGVDGSATWLAELCKERGLTPRLQPKSMACTASYTAMVDPDGQLVQALANMDVYDLFDSDMVESAPQDWLVVDANLKPETLHKVIGKPAAKRIGLTVSAAKAPRLLPVLEQLDLLFTNGSELSALLEASGSAAVTNLGVKQVVVSNGHNRLEILEDGVKSTIMPPALPPDDIASVVGAGDGLAAGTLVALWEGAPLSEAVQRGVAVAQQVLRWPGPWADTVPTLFSRTGNTP